MIIKEIELNNIRSHGNTRISFSNGINVITGNTGSGKSSILMGVQYALFGQIDESKGTTRFLLRNGASKGTVTLRFEEDGSEYSIRRGIKRVNDSVRNDDSLNTVSKDDRPVDLQNRASDLNDYVLRVLKIDSSEPIKMFEAITYIKQDELKDLILESDQKKQTHIDRLLQLNKYADAFDGLKDVVSTIGTDIEKAEASAAIIEDENEIIKIESRIATLELANGDAEKSLRRLEDSLANEQIRKKQIESERKFYEEKKSEYANLTATKNAKKASMERSKSAASDIKATIARETNSISEFSETKLADLKKLKIEKETALERIVAEERESHDRLYRAQQEQIRTRERIASLRKDIETLRKQNETLTEQNRDIEKSLKASELGSSDDEINGRLRQIETIIADTRSEMTSAMESGRCQLCGKEISDDTHIKREYDARIRRYEALAKSLSDGKGKKFAGKTRRDLESEYERNTAIIVHNADKMLKFESEIPNIDLTATTKELEAATDLSKTILARQIEAKNGLDTIKRSLDAAEASRSAMAKISANRAQLELLNAQIERFGEEITAIEEKMTAIALDPLEDKRLETVYKDVLNVINETSSGISGIRGEIKARESEISDKNIALDEIKAKLKRKAEIQKSLERERRFLKLIESLREDIRDIREYVRDRFIREFKSVFLARFLEIRNESDYSVDVDNDYNVKVIASGETLDAKALSGGEKTSVALAYRMALSSVASMLGGIGKNEVLLMDEPTSGLDKEDINALSTCITRITDINQIIIVTHEDTMKTIADNLITVSKTAGESRVSSYE